jgi:hypothetical protein
MKSLQLIGLMVLAVSVLYGQSGPVFWSPTQPDCSSLHESAIAVPNEQGLTMGYSCYVAGTFLWLAAGGVWGTSIRVAAPASGAIGVGYSFYDANGTDLSLDSTGSATGSGSFAAFALYANQPAEIELRGATTDAPSYSHTATGSVYAVFFCPDAVTCSNVLPQLIYSALPTYPWSLSVPIAWDTAVSKQWSAEGIDDGGTHRVSLVIYNESQTATTFTVRVYNSAGTLVGTGTTPSIAGFPTLSDGALGEAATYGVLLSQLIKAPLPSGIFKILVDGGTVYSAVEVLQVNGSSATTLQVAYDTTPASTASAAVHASNLRRMRVASAAKRAFHELVK